MYKEFFNFRERPFSKTPDPLYLYPSRSHREALARLLHAVEEREIILLTGDIGCGKTTLSRALLDELGDTARVALVTNPRLSPLELLYSVAFGFGVETPAKDRLGLLGQIEQILFDLFHQGRLPVLIIDEAHLIPHRDTFEEIRLLTNFQLDDGNLLSVIFLGQPELRLRLSHPAYEPLRQRIGLQYKVGPLSLEETAAYIRHRLSCAGCVTDIFLEDAVIALYRFSGGVPRRINQAASLALLEAFGREQAQVDASIIAEVAAELSGI
ncbi:ExeA family protein [Geopsychrobacter electrodiphilus]|uniref:ExeA family protein n=1 Tax=Geopsychrobacter electrodiphilus TaxID=225196 RepID=UPI00036653E8|nr:tRNA (adenosine(37)-N6)-threonylcarbamoyltransferase complex ATPase subunit type 1 TsaE [Geopsychrobacter electrodiphilus]